MWFNQQIRKNYLGLLFLDVTPSRNVFFNQAISLHEFNKTGQLSGLISGSSTIADISKEAFGGIGESLSISILVLIEGIFATKEDYGLDQIGSTYTFKSFIKREDNSGYSDFGFTACSTATVSTDFGYEPNDALGVTNIDDFAIQNGIKNNSRNWEINYTSGSISTVMMPSFKTLLKKKLAPNYSIFSLSAFTSLVILEVNGLLRIPFSSCVNQYSLTI